MRFTMEPPAESGLYWASTVTPNADWAIPVPTHYTAPCPHCGAGRRPKAAGRMWWGGPFDVPEIEVVRTERVIVPEASAG